MQPPLWVFYSRTKFSFCVQESRIEQHLRKRTRKQREVLTEVSVPLGPAVVQSQRNNYKLVGLVSQTSY